RLDSSAARIAAWARPTASWLSGSADAGTKLGGPTRVGSTDSTSSSARCASPTARLAKPGPTLLMIGSWYFGSSIDARPKNGKHLDSGTVTPSIVNVMEPVPRRPATCQSSMSVTSSRRTTVILISGRPPIPGFGAPASSTTTTLASTQCAYVTPLAKG